MFTLEILPSTVAPVYSTTQVPTASTTPPLINTTLNPQTLPETSKVSGLENTSLTTARTSPTFLHATLVTDTPPIINVSESSAHNNSDSTRSEMSMKQTMSKGQKDVTVYGVVGGVSGLIVITIVIIGLVVWHRRKQHNR